MDEDGQQHPIKGIFFVAGSCIGGGTISLPFVTACIGFFPALFVMLFSWFVMLLSGLMINKLQESFEEEVNFVTMASEVFGPAGKAVAWVSFLFLFYSLMVAYFCGLAQFGSLLSLSSETTLLLSFVLACYLFFQGSSVCILVNAVLVWGLVLSYFFLMKDLLLHVQVSRIYPMSFSCVYCSIPAMITSFGFQNTIPTLLRCFPRRVVSIVLLGSVIVFFMYASWLFVVLGSFPLSTILLARETGMGLALLGEVVGLGKVSVWGTAFFSFFALSTSLITQGMSLMDLFANSLSFSREKQRTLLIVLSLLPPFVFSLFFPSFFFKALGLAGGIFAMVLFGLFPATMVWLRLPYRRNYAALLATSSLFVIGCTVAGLYVGM